MALIKPFENDVKMYGTQTMESYCVLPTLFENDVKMYGTQTQDSLIEVLSVFENDVKMYGTQTIHQSRSTTGSLRMM